MGKRTKQNFIKRGNSNGQFSYLMSYFSDLENCDYLSALHSISLKTFEETQNVYSEFTRQGMFL
jgi:hypothetical protein